MAVGQYRGGYRYVIALDFDGTCVRHDFPEIGPTLEKHQKVINYIRRMKALGATIVLWTCREDTPERAYLTEAVNHCRANGIPIDYANEYPLQEANGFWKSRKLAADEYIDDKAINVDSFI